MNTQRKADEREARKHLIMDSALSVFHDQGIDGTTMEQIANEAGFGTASLYYYFPKKEDVFSAIMVKGWKQLWESCQFTIESHHSPKEKFLSIFYFSYLFLYHFNHIKIWIFFGFGGGN